MLRRLRHRLSKTCLRVPLMWLRHRGLTRRDVFLASYPRSGNTWLRFLLFEAVSGRAAQFGEIDEKSSPAGHLGDHSHMPEVLPGGGRLIKTHEAYRREYRKAVYLVRDPRDVILSEHRFVRWRGYYDRELPEFVPVFLRGEVNGFGSWRDHVASWLESDLAARGDLLIIRFEDLRADTEEWLRRIVGFLGLEVSGERLREIIHDNSIARMREREDQARATVYKDTDRRFRFVNQGAVAGWRSKLAPEVAERIETTWRQTLDRLGYLRAA